MRLAHIQEARVQQTQRIDPRQIISSEILSWTTAELEAAVEREMAENPALETRDGEPFISSSGATFTPERDTPPVLSGDTRLRLTEYTGDAAPSLPREPVALTLSQGGDDDPFLRLAASPTLHDHLRGQVGQAARAGDVCPDIVCHLVEWVDDRGYLTADLTEIAERFRIGRGDIDRAVRALQTMEPVGVGARDLRECLLLQAEHLELTGEGLPLLRPLLMRCWDDLIARREERIAVRLRCCRADVQTAMAFVQSNLTPFPGAAFRPSCFALTGGSPVRPDLIFTRTPAGFTVEMPRDFEGTLIIAPQWKSLADQPASVRDEAMRRYIRDHVDRAQTFLTGVARRGQTLRRIAAALVVYQGGYLETGNRAFLRPLTRQSLAELLEMDESVVSRAVADKWVQLPGGETVPLDAFFGCAHAIRDALAQLVAGEDEAQPYSDEEIADILAAQGYPLARRTVAKYRGLEKILPARLRRREAGGRRKAA